MMWIEIVSRQRELVHRYRCDGAEARIGRAYDNDVIVDDPAVAPHHLRIFRDENGALVAEDLGSTNGLFDGDAGGKARVTRIQLDGDRPLRIGRTYLRIRDASYAVPPEREIAAPRSTWSIVVLLAAAVFGLELLSMWLGETAEPKLSRYLVPVLGLVFIVVAWTTCWSILSRIFAGHASFVRHLAIALAGLLVFSVFGELVDFGAYSLSWRWLAEYSYVANWLIFAALCFYHLRAIGPTRLKAKAIGLAALAGVAIATQSLAQAETRSWFGQRAYVRNLKPPMLRLARPQTEEAFFGDAEALKPALDKARKDPPQSPGLLPNLDDD